MNKEQSADDPSVDLIRVKNMLNSTISMSYLMLYQRIEHMFWKHSSKLRQYRSTIIIWRIILCTLITITANHSNLLAQTEPTRSSSLSGKEIRKSNYCNALVIKWIYNIVLFEWKNAGCSFFITRIDVYAFQCQFTVFQWPRLRNSRTPFCSRAMLICSIIWLGKRCCGLLFCGFCSSSLTWGCPVFKKRWFVLSEVVFTLSWCRSINTIPAS